MENGVQATGAGGRRALPAVLLASAALALVSCGNQNPVMTPVGWWHDLQGGEIAATRPPPPGADLPYPKLGTIPPKPILPSNSFRDTVRDQLTAQRDDNERLAARHPIEALALTPPPPQAPAAPGADTANATLPGVEAPPPKPAAGPGPATPSGAPAAAADGGPAAGTAVTIAGNGVDTSDLPPIPAAPPAPATFEEVAALPAPTPAPPLPAHLPRAFQGAAVFFATGSAVLDSSQTETMKDAAARRGKGHVDVEGHGDALGDSPEAQLAAVTLAVKRAQAVADALEKQHVPAEAIRLSATAFGRGAAVRDAP